MPVTRQGDTTIMTPETVQAMIDQAPCKPTSGFSSLTYVMPTIETYRGPEGVVGLSRWFEKMESIYHINGCAIGNQVKFATCTLLGAVLTWWNGHVRTLGHDAAYAMT
ncbi:hypothetical protein Tco_0686567 [Tanacetum coccineum]